MASQGSKDVCNTIPKSREWLIIIFFVNVAGVALFAFYIFKGSRMQEDYIKLCRQEHAWQCRKKFNWQLTSSSNGLLFFAFQRGFSREYTSFDPRWAWVTCHYTSTWTNNIIQIGHGNLTFTYVTCVVTTGYHLLQALQECFQKREGLSNGKI